MKKLINKIFGNNDAEKPQKSSVKADFIQFLNAFNCKFKIEDDRDDKLVRIFFDYQGGHFVAVIKDNNLGVDVNYPSFADAPTDELQLVRAMCNRSNNNSSVLKFTYTFDENKNLLRVHMSFFCTAVYTDDITDLLDACFYFQRSFCDEYNDARDNQKSHETHDIERTFARNARERFLIAQQEISHQQDNNPHLIRHTFNDGVAMGEFIDTALSLDAHVCHALTVVRDNQVHFATTKDIDAWLLSQLLIDGQGTDARFACKQAVAIVELTAMAQRESDNQPAHQLLTITALPDGSDDTSLYFRVTASLSPLTTSRNTALNSRVNNTTTMLIAYDKTSAKQKQQEFDYMWQDAKIKMRDGEELTDEQQLIIDITDANIGYCIYWGKHHMLNNRYVEAILMFENAYYAMRTVFFKLSDELKTTFGEVCYNLGFCYTELMQYQKAFYYLHMLEDDGNIKHNSELINCLANNKDIRVFKIIDQIMSAIQQHITDDGEVPEDLQSFVNFLRRRRAYALIDFDDLDEAEKAFTQMLDEPENSDYALGELAYIKQLRKTRATTDPEQEPGQEPEQDPEPPHITQ